jgi:hypothetical protein
VAAFAPTSLSGCVLWLRADLGVTLNGSTVSAWADQSGTGNHASQGTAANQPTYSASSGPGGSRPGITFDGADDNLGIGSGLSAVFGGVNAAYTVVVSAKIPGATTASLFSASHSSTAAFFRLQQLSTNLRPFKRDDASNQAAPSFTGPAYGSWAGIQALCSGTTITVRVDNTTPATQAFSAASTATINQASIGSAGGVSEPSNAAIWEVIVYSRLLSGAESTQIRDYQVTYGASA